MRNFAALTCLFVIAGRGSALVNHDRGVLSLVSSFQGQASDNFGIAREQLRQLRIRVSSCLSRHVAQPEDNSFFFPWSEESWFGFLDDINPPLYALIFGTLASLSLPAGAWLGVTFSPVSNTVCAGMMAFGAGALLFAVTIEIYGHALHKLEAERLGFEQMLAMILGTFAGSIFYMVMSRRLEESDQIEQEESFVAALPGRQESVQSVLTVPSCKSEGHQDVANEEAIPAQTVPAQTVPAQTFGDEGGRRSRPRSLSPARRQLSRNPSIFSEPELGRVAEEPAAYLRVPSISRLRHPSESSMSEHSFQSRRSSWKSVRMRASAKSTSESVDAPQRIRAREQGLWYMMTTFMIQEEPTSANSLEGKAHAKSVAKALFLGLLIDGVPEGILMGFLAAEERLSPVFVVSIFLANFPEAFSSGSLFTVAETPARVVMGMWSGLCFLTGLLAGISCWLLLWAFPHYGPDRSHLPMSVLLGIALVQGATGGSMLACISSVMLPDAFQRAGKEVHVMASSGLLCTSGFVLSLTIKALGG